MGKPWPVLFLDDYKSTDTGKSTSAKLYKDKGNYVHKLWETMIKRTS